MHRTSARAVSALSLLAGAAALLFVSGCGDTEEPGDPVPRPAELRDENNYTSQSSIDIPTVVTASGTDLDICWEDVVTDIQCHAVDPVPDLDNVVMLRFLNLSEEEIEERITAGNLKQSDLNGFVQYNTDHESGCTKLSSLTLQGTEIDVSEEYVESEERYMLLFTEGTTLGVGARTMVFIEPSTASTVTDVAAPAGCGMLEFDADIASAEPVTITDKAPWPIDFSDLTRDGQGNDVIFTTVDGMVLGFYEGMTVADVEGRIFDLETMATELYKTELDSERRMELDRAIERETGEAFSGFERDAEGVWLFGLTCSSCQNPAPIALTVLQVGGGR